MPNDIFLRKYKKPCDSPERPGQNKQRPGRRLQNCHESGGHPDLSSIFHEKSKQSEDFISELQAQVSRLEGENNADTTFAGKIFRIWMEIKNTFKANNTASILDSCEFGEAAAIRAYDEALHSDVKIPADIRQLILEQQTAIKKSQDLIRKYGNLTFYGYNNSFT